ncbi:PREDICTED: xanthine dehydrogenase/oxidase-like [Acropora digitifera]|uniref:xanthine dehydrogenase/oxidase-like n=1 Tax=Acropora digitifera TaxID=70779 RepID=UPI00077ADE15|nr:PREDICTED: xanthine dehydrogenase/oxidase-like [Acropora digitifera]
MVLLRSFMAKEKENRQFEEILPQELDNYLSRILLSVRKKNGDEHFLLSLIQEVPPDQSLEDVVGRPLPHLAATKQATGEAAYCDDIPKYAGELYAGIVFSKKAHANILAVDPSDALRLPGVKSFVSADDVPGQNTTGPVTFDEEIFATEKVTCVGQIIGAVLAETQSQAQRAAKMVKITYEELPRILTIEEAIAAESFLDSTPLCIEKGDLKAGFDESDHLLEGEMRVGGQEHFYLETQASIAVPKGEDGEMELFVSTQSPTLTQLLVARALGVPQNRIVVRTKRMGGGFGGKETRNCPLTSVVAVAATKVGKPVRCMLDRDEDMTSTGTRHPFLVKYKVGFTVNGKIKALDVTLYSNAGNSLDRSLGVMERAIFHSDNCYLISNIRLRGYVCKTNIPSNTAFRGFGGPQGMFFTESWMSDVASICGISQKQVREINFYHEGDLTHFNQELVSCHIRRIWSELLEKCRYEERKQQVECFNSENRWKKRGIALTPTKFGISFTATFLNQVNLWLIVHNSCSLAGLYCLLDKSPSSGKKKGFQTHESSDSHVEEVARYVTAPGTVIGDIVDLLSEEHALENSKNRKILLSILSNIRYFARQAFPLRGDRGLSEEKSNFHQLLNLRAQENPEIIEWLRKRDEKYTLPEIQNELLEAMAPGMMRQISANIQNATFFMIMADEAADVSNKEQLVICIRFAPNDFPLLFLQIACEQILERLKPYQMENPKGSWEEWVSAAYFDRVNLSANGFYKTPDLAYDWKTNMGRLFNYFCFGAGCSEVEIDCLTGDHQVLRTDIVMDVGTSLNPAIDIGQVEGAFVQGLGLFTIEELRYSQSGAPWTTGPGAYKIPGFADIPVEFYVHLLRSAPNEKAVYSSKAVGEPPLFLASSVFYAIKDAITSARRDAGVEGIFRLDSPATSERIRMACVDKFTEQFTKQRDPSVKDFNVYP